MKKLKSNEFALLVAILSVATQAPHTYFVMYSISNPGMYEILRVTQAVLAAIVIDMALLFYTVRNRKDIALVFAGMQIAVNFFYYYKNLGFTENLIAGIIMSIMLPVSVYYYSEEIKEDAPEPEEVSETDTKLSFEMAQEIRKLRDSDHKAWTYNKLADKYNVHFTTIAKVLTGKIWKDEDQAA